MAQIFTTIITSVIMVFLAVELGKIGLGRVEDGGGNVPDAVWLFDRVTHKTAKLLCL